MSQTETNWKTSYDSSTNGYYHPPEHSHTGNRSILDEERFMNNKHQPLDSQALQTIQRKISKQKIAAERRTDHSNGDYMFESSHPHSTYSTPFSSQNRQHSPLPPRATSSQSFPSEADTVLRHSANSRNLHGHNDTILTNDFEHQAFHQPNTRKVTKIIPKENYSLSNNRPTQPRSVSASSSRTIKHESKNTFLTPNDAQRLRNTRRHEPVHVQSGPGSKTSLITPDSWKGDPVSAKKPTKKKTVTETTSKSSRTDVTSKLITEQSSLPNKQPTEKPNKRKRAKSASKPTSTERTPAKPKQPEKVEKTQEEKDKEKEQIKKYIQEKRQEQEKKVLNEKKLKSVHEKERKAKLQKLNEQIKKVAQLPLPPSLIKKSSSSALIPSKDLTDQTRERLLHLLGPKPFSEPPAEYHSNTPFEHPPLLERSLSASSSSSSSSDSVVEIQPPKLNAQTVVRSHAEPPIQNAEAPKQSAGCEGVINGAEHRHHNILRWAANLTRDCDVVENKFKYLRPDGTQPFDIIPASHQQLQQHDGNLRFPTPVLIANGQKTESEPIIAPKVLRPSGRLSHLNQNRTSEYQGQKLPGVGNLRDPLLERRVKRDRAATQIQAAYRGYTVRKSLHWFNGKQQQLHSEFNKRSTRKPMKIPSHTTDMFDAPAINLDMRFSDDNFTIGSTLLRHYQQNGTIPTPSTSIDRPIFNQPQKQQQQKIQRPSSLQTYSDDYENITTSRSSTPVNHKQIPQKPRVIQQPVLNIESSGTPTPSSSSSSTSTTPTPTPRPHVLTNTQHRRSISPPLAPPMSPDNGRALHHHRQPPLPITTSHRVLDERRYSPDALERQLNAELHLLDGVEASMKQIENMERLRSVALAQQEVVSLAQVIQNRPSANPVPQQQIRNSAARQVTSSSATSSSSSSSSSNPKRRSSPPQQPSSSNKHPRHRTTQPSDSPSSSSESTLNAREKRVRQKVHSDTELQAYEKRLKDVEKKLRLLVKRENNNDTDYKQLEQVLNAFEVLDEKRTAPSPRALPKSSNDSSISEDLPVSHKSSISTASTVQRKGNKETSEIRTETIQKDSDSSSASTQRRQSDSVTTDVSDLERRIRGYREQLKTKKHELDKLKERKNKDDLRKQEDQLKKQLQTYNDQIETLRVQPAPPKVQQVPKVPPTATRRSPIKSISSSSSSSSSTEKKPQESSIAEDLPVTTTASQSKSDIVEKRTGPIHPVVQKERDFFDDDDDDDEEEDKKKEVERKPLATPRDERDSQHDAQSISFATDLAASSDSEKDDSRRPSTDNGKPVLNLNTNLPSSPKPKVVSKSPSPSPSSSSSSTTTTPSKKSPKQQAQTLPFERKPSPISNEYDEDFSEISHSPATPTKEPLSKIKVDDIDIESIQEDLEDKPSVHDTNHSLTSKSSGDEQSEILVLVKKSANTTPRRPDDKSPEELLPPAPPMPLSEPKIESINNDDTSHDVSDEDEPNDQETKIDRLTDAFLRTFIDEAIDQGKQLKRLKKDADVKKTSITQEAQEWMSDDDDVTEDDNVKQINVRPDELSLDLSDLDLNNPDERRVESPRKVVIEEPVKLLVPHTREQVIPLCDQAIKILFDQNTDFSERAIIQCQIPNSYFTSNQQDSDDEDIRRNHHAYCQMVFDLTAELLHEMYTENVQPAAYPEWQNAKLVSKRFYRGEKPENRRDIAQIVQAKVLEILNLNSRQITYSKWRVSNGRRNGIEKFETVLDEEIRRTESQWVNYDDDCTQLKFEIADLIFDQLIQETMTECFDVVDKRLHLSSNSTRL